MAKKVKQSKFEWLKKNIVIVPVIAAILAGTFTSIRYVLNLTDTIEENKTALTEINRDIDEIPHPLVIETMDLLSELTDYQKDKVHFIHMNHTNQMLDQTCDITRNVLNKGFNIARLGEKFHL